MCLMCNVVVILCFQSLNDVGLVVKDAIVLLDRGQGGKARLKDNGINLHRLYIYLVLMLINKYYVIK